MYTKIGLIIISLCVGCLRAFLVYKFLPKFPSHYQSFILYRLALVLLYLCSLVRICVTVELAMLEKKLSLCLSTE